MSWLRAAVVLSLWALPAWAVPPTPWAYAPLDGGWSVRPPYLRAQISPAIPQDVTQFEFELQSPLGVPVAQGAVPVNRQSSLWLVDWRPPSPPDAGEHFWRARAVDGLGTPSAWMPWLSFRIDDEAPPYPSAVTLDEQDGGRVRVSCSAVTDSQSGVAAYHWLLGQLDSPDGGVGSAPGGPTTPTPARELYLGPGRWHVGAHAHDVVGNSLSTSPAWLPVVVPPPTLPAPPQPLVTQANGAPFPTAPYQNVNRLYVRFGDAGVDGGAFLLIQSNADSGVWTWAIDTLTATANVYENDGRYEVRSALVVGDQVSDYSPSVFVWVDGARPRPTAQVDGGLDGGEVLVSWVPALDTNPTSTGSGVARYHVHRVGAGASAQVATVPAAGPLVFADRPAVGLWEYVVVSEDNAGNRSFDGGRALVTVPIAIDAPAVRLVAECGRPWATTLTAGDAGPTTWRLVDGPPGTSVDAASGAVSWLPTPAQAGPRELRVRAEVSGATDEVTLTVNVSCEVQRYGVGCACSEVDASALSLAALGVLAWLRRAARRR